MALKKYKPITAGTRWRVGNAYAEITTDTPEKSLLEKVKSTAGRNVQGRRAMRYRGGGHKKMYRIIDFKRKEKYQWCDSVYRIRSVSYGFYRPGELCGW
jgi:large subunit ribosomal protein L2